MNLKIKQVINSEKRFPSSLPYSQAIQTGSTVYLSGIIGQDLQDGNIVNGGFEAQARQVLFNLGTVLEAAGCTYRDVVKTTVLLADINDFAMLNKIYGDFFKEDPPARSTYQVANLPRGARLEIESIAVCEKKNEKLISQL
jgi:reactive intermediate/imine deaminase